jgi:hypothetical protein
MGSFSGLVFLQKVPADASRICTKRFVERLFVSDEGFQYFWRTSVTQASTSRSRTVTVRCAESLAVHSATRDIPGRLGLLR